MEERRLETIMQKHVSNMMLHIKEHRALTKQAPAQIKSDHHTHTPPHPRKQEFNQVEMNRM